MNYKKIKFIGGGRWASILLTELLANFQEYKIDWYTTNIDKCKSTIEEMHYKRINFANNINNNNYDKIIIASNSLNHLTNLKENLEQEIPILIEKPIFDKVEEYKKLNQSKRNKIFLNLEYFNAYFIKDFKKEINFRTLKKVDVIWHDPFVEIRDDSIKYS